MKKAVILFLVFLVLAPVYAQVHSRFQAIKGQIDTILKITNTPGCAIVIVEGEKVLFTQGYGYRDYRNKIPVDANTIFSIGSTTKAFTAALLGQLREKEQLTFEASPIEYVQALKFYNEDLNKQVSIQDLMSMRTGLALHDKAWSGIPLNDRDSLLSRIAYLEPSHKLRTHWNYSNFSYFILGAISEKLTGRTWEENVARSLFKPLNMNRSSFGLQGLKEHSNVSLGYTVINNQIDQVEYFDIGAMGPAGSINSTANDMGKWLLTWINQGKFNGRQILPEPYIMEAMSPQAVIPKGYLADEEYSGMYSANYGYGWILSDYKGHYRVEHGGSIDGFRATVAFFPNKKIGIAVLTNQVGYEAALMIRNTIADNLLDATKTDWVALYIRNQENNPPPTTIGKKPADARPSITMPPHQRKELVGSYINPGYGKVEIFNEEGSLYTYFRRRKLKITPSATEAATFHATTLVYPYKMGMPPLRFNQNKEGKITSLSIEFESGLKAIEFTRVTN